MMAKKSGMIQVAKDTLETAIKSRIPEITIARSAAEESRAIMARQFPLAALITNPGKFDDRTAGTARYANAETGNLVQRYIRGSRIIPILVRVWAEGEEEADEVFSRIIPAIPRKWEYDGFEGLIVINSEEHSDHTGNTAKQFLSVAEVQFTAKAALDEEILPTFNNVTAESEIT
jgi:hypothetical protein